MALVFQVLDAYNVKCIFRRVEIRQDLCALWGFRLPGEVVMFTQNQKRAGFRMVLLMVVLAGMYGVVPNGVRAERSAEVVSTGKACSPGSGWMWVNRPSEPEIAVQVQQRLAQQGIRAKVEASNYGERDAWMGSMCPSPPGAVSLPPPSGRVPSISHMAGPCRILSVRSVT